MDSPQQSRPPTIIGGHSACRDQERNYVCRRPVEKGLTASCFVPAIERYPSVMQDIIDKIAYGDEASIVPIVDVISECLVSPLADVMREPRVTGYESA
jgi:hypothetical protein